jgi:hypothetical protein
VSALTHSQTNKTSPLRFVCSYLLQAGICALKACKNEWLNKLLVSGWKASRGLKVENESCPVHSPLQASHVLCLMLSGLIGIILLGGLPKLSCFPGSMFYVCCMYLPFCDMHETPLFFILDWVWVWVAIAQCCAPHVPLVALRRSGDGRIGVSRSVPLLGSQVMTVVGRTPPNSNATSD